jgi:hypothetical protein
MVNVVALPASHIPLTRHAAATIAAATIAAGLTAVPLAACTHHEPPTPEGAPSRARPEPVATAGPEALPSAPLAPPVQEAGTDPAVLPQTRDLPHASGVGFDARVAALWDAIANDEPDRAMVFFFPLNAYEQVKDVGAPAADWKHRLVAAYAHDIHALHGSLGGPGRSAVGGARLVRLEVPEARARWVEPGEEYNKIGYFRVLGSKLRYEVDGTEHAFDVKSLISWRGQWYVVHLSAIK